MTLPCRACLPALPAFLPACLPALPACHACLPACPACLPPCSSMNRGISGGQAKRVNIGIALVTNPRVLFLGAPAAPAASPV